MVSQRDLVHHSVSHLRRRRLDGRKRGLRRRLVHPKERWRLVSLVYSIHIDPQWEGNSFGPQITMSLFRKHRSILPTLLPSKVKNQELRPSNPGHASLSLLQHKQQTRGHICSKPQRPLRTILDLPQHQALTQIQEKRISISCCNQKPDQYRKNS